MCIRDSDDAGESRADEPVSEKKLSVGASVELSNGMTISVDEIVPGLANYCLLYTSRCV